jgi:hypothetical protein
MKRAPSSGRVFRSITRSLLAVIVGAGVLLTAMAAAPAASATTTSGSVVYTAQLNIPAPPSSNFAGSAGGDGWALAFTSTAVYNVFHHNATMSVACHLQTDASPCWSAPKVITDLSGNNFTAAGQPGLWMDQNTGYMYMYTTRTPDLTAGVVCVDTTQPASNLDPFCGFTPLTAVGAAPLGSGGYSMASAPQVVGTNWYSFNAVNGSPSGDGDKMMCFSLTTFSACPSQPFAVNLGSSVSVADPYYPSPPIVAFGTKIVVPAQLATTAVLACYDASTGGSCTGSWPVDITSLGYVGSQGAAFPVLNNTGTPTSFCLPQDALPCFGFDGSSIATPAGLSTAIPSGNSNWNGTAVTLGARVYVPNGNTNSVDCFDYTAGTTCTGYPKVISNLSLLYTVNPDPQRPSCIWVNADNGSAQIQNFDAYTGGACGQGPVRVLAASIVAPSNECIPANYTSLQVTSPTPGQYTSGSVQFEDFNGNPIPSIADQPLDASGSVNLAPLNLTTLSPLPQFLITLNGAGSPPEVDVKLTWTGSYSPTCTTGNQHASSGQGYRLGARDGGVFSFGQAAFYGSMTGKHLNGPEVGIASTVDDGGYWLAAADGGVFAFGDANYYGGLGGGAHLNAPVVGIAATPTGKGYWLVTADGGVFAYGDAVFQGSLGARGNGSPIVGIAATPTGKGYWLAAADGAVFAYGDASYHGSMHDKALKGPVTGIAGSHGGAGYVLVASDGGVFAFGDAPFKGSLSGKHIEGSAVGIQVTPSGDGYWLDATDGGVFAFGDAQFLGCMAGSPLNASLASISS